MQLSSEQWNERLLSLPGASFLQSWEWGSVQRERSLPYRRFFLTNNGQAQVLAIRHPLPWGRSWIYLPRGPLSSTALDLAPRTKFFQPVIAWARQEKAAFIHVEPPQHASANASPLTFSGFAWRPSTHALQPLQSLVLDLAASREQMLAAMHAKTRYNIRLAERHNVTVRFSREQKDLDSFLQLAPAVHERSGFRYHEREYYQVLLRVLGAADMLELAIAEHEKEVLAVSILLSFGDTVTYAHGASASIKRHFMAPYLLQWESIKRAKDRGYSHYDFYGISPQSAADHPWAGITRFKTGFGGSRISYPAAQDYVLDKGMYQLYCWARKLRNLRR